MIFYKRSVAFRSFIFSLLFFVNGFVFGQIKSDSIKPQPVISVKNGASIYSLDESFNEQIKNSNIVKDGKTTIARNSNNRETATIESSSKKVEDHIQVKSFADSAKIKLKQQNLKNVKKHLEVIDKVKKKLVYIASFSSENFGTFSISKGSISVSVNQNDYKECSYCQSCFEIIKRLDFLASQKITAYNSQSLGYTIVSHLKVRPPPTA